MLSTNKKIFYLGRYPKSNVLTGPEKYTISLFHFVSEYENVEFIEYFFKSYKGSNFFSRLFGKEIDVTSKITRLGFIRLLFYLLKRKPYVIHVLTAERYIIPVYLLKIIIPWKIVTTFHGVLKYEIPNNRNRMKKINSYRDYLFELCAVRFSDRLIFLSQLHLDLADRYYNFSKNKTIIIPNGIDADFIRDDHKEFNNNLLKFVFYNGINDGIERGINYILDSVQKLEKTNIELFIIGGDSKISNFQCKIEFLGPMKKHELIDFLNDKHFLIKSIIYDSFPILAIETMAAGLIPIVSDKIGISSYIKSGINGFVYSSSDNNALKYLLDEVLSGKYNLNIMSEEAKKIINELNWPAVSEKYLKLYRTL